MANAKRRTRSRGDHLTKACFKRIAALLYDVHILKAFTLSALAEAA
jgi:hypothetical protein